MARMKLIFDCTEKVRYKFSEYSELEVNPGQSRVFLGIEHMGYPASETFK